MIFFSQFSAKSNIEPKKGSSKMLQKILRIVTKLVRIRHPSSVIKLLMILAICTFLISGKLLRDLVLRVPDPTEVAVNKQPTSGETKELLDNEFELLNGNAVLDKMVIAESTSKKLALLGRNILLKYVVIYDGFPFQRPRSSRC